MGKWDEFRFFGEELERRLRLKTSPLGIKLLKSPEEIPKGSKRPLKDFGYHLSTCQAFAMSRRAGVTIASLKEDMWCPEPVIGYGIEEGLSHLLKDCVGYPSVFETKKACRSWHRSLPHLKLGKFIGVLSAPLTRVNFIPGVAVIYCDPAQLTQLLIAVHWKEGRPLQILLSGHTACVFAIVPPAKEKKYQVTLPCIGDRRRAMAQDEEIIFSAPGQKLGDLLAGLRHRDSSGSGLPYLFSMATDYPLPDFYVKLAKKLGMESEKKKD
jgi:uncharacterized protein (DUF169 family)